MNHLMSGSQLPTTTTADRLQQCLIYVHLSSIRYSMLTPVPGVLLRLGRCVCTVLRKRWQFGPKQGVPGGPMTKLLPCLPPVYPDYARSSTALYMSSSMSLAYS